MAKISKEELEWRAQDDARILAQYQEIISDTHRSAGSPTAAVVNGRVSGSSKR